MVECRMYISYIGIETLQTAQDAEWQAVSDYFDEKAPRMLRRRQKPLLPNATG